MTPRWIAEHKPVTDQFLIYATAHGEDVADVLTTLDDATLMAAAPDLLHALRDLLAATDRLCITHGDVARLDAAREQAREAIRRTR